MLGVDSHSPPNRAFSVVQRNHSLFRPSPGYLLTSLFGPAKGINQTHKVLPGDFSEYWDATVRRLETAAGFASTTYTGMLKGVRSPSCVALGFFRAVTFTMMESLLS